MNIMIINNMYHISIQRECGLVLFLISKKLRQIYKNYNGNIIRSYRIERAVSVDMLMDINLEKEIMIYKRLIHAVDIHRKAMQLVYLFCNISLL